MPETSCSEPYRLTARERLALLLYQLGAVVAVPFVALYLLWRSIRQPDYRAHWRQRFLGWMNTDHDVSGKGIAHAFPDAMPGKVLWIHAVSVGETRAAASLIEQWLNADPEHCLILTHGTPTGRAAGRDILNRFQDSTGAHHPRWVQCYLPYDLPWAVRRFLRWASPDTAVFMETELWPVLLATLRRRNMPTLLANARLSPRSARRMSFFRSLARPALGGLTMIAAQSAQDAEAFANVFGTHGAIHIDVVGSMKFDLAVEAHHRTQASIWRSGFAHRRIWLAASTREGEEALVLQAWRRGLDQTRLDATDLLVIVPRHPQRFQQVAEDIRRRGFRCSQRSSWPEGGMSAHVEGVEIILGDSMGEMLSYMAMADVVLAAGSLLPFGGQNPIEACASGRPVFFGPHMFNFEDVANTLLAAGAAIRVRDAGQWIDEGMRLLRDPAEFSQRSVAAVAAVERYRGASARLLEWITVRAGDR